jgi:methylthioribose-1-phosphate isomerase
MKFKTIEWKGDRVRLLDQRRLPGEVCYIDCRDPSSLARAIQTMAIRGAPAIGVAASMGIALAAQKSQTRNLEVFLRNVKKVCQQMRQTRPTAVNLFWAVNRMERLLDQTRSFSAEEIKVKIEKEALRIYKEDLQINRKIGEMERGSSKMGWGVNSLQCRGLATAESDGAGSHSSCLERGETLPCFC